MMNLGAARVAPEKAAFRPVLPMSFVPGITEIQMAKMTYAEQLKHPNWQRRRLEMLDAAGFECQGCESKDKTLHVHHRDYFKGRMAWEYSDDELQVLCEDCHANEHEQKDAFSSLMRFKWKEGATGMEMAHGIVSGLLFALKEIDAEIAIKQRNNQWFAIGFLLAAVGPAGLAAKVRSDFAATGDEIPELLSDILSEVEGD